MLSSRRFAINLLSAEQSALSDHFADSKNDDKFAEVAWSPGRATGCPILAWRSRLARVRSWSTFTPVAITTSSWGACSTSRFTPGSPLVYFRGAYARLWSPFRKHEAPRNAR